MKSHLLEILVLGDHVGIKYGLGAKNKFQCGRKICCDYLLVQMKASLRMQDLNLVHLLPCEVNSYCPNPCLSKIFHLCSLVQ